MNIATRIITIALLMACFIISKSQDTLYRVDKRVTLCKITKVNNKIIDFLPWEAQDGPEHEIVRAKVAYLVYQGGRIVSISDASVKSTPVAAVTTPMPVTSVPADNPISTEASSNNAPITVPEPEFASHPYYLEDGSLKNFDRADAVLDTKVKGYIGGVVDQDYTAFSPKSSVRFSKENLPHFYIKILGEVDVSDNPIKLHVAEIKKDRRLFKVASQTFSPAGGKVRDVKNSEIVPTLKKVRDGIYEIVFENGLHVGEYAFGPLPSNGELKLYCFAVTNEPSPANTTSTSASANTSTSTNSTPSQTKEEAKQSVTSTPNSYTPNGPTSKFETDSNVQLCGFTSSKSTHYLGQKQNYFYVNDPDKKFLNSKQLICLGMDFAYVKDVNSDDADNSADIKLKDLSKLCNFMNEDPGLYFLSDKFGNGRKVKPQMDILKRSWGNVDEKNWVTSDDYNIDPGKIPAIIRATDFGQQTDGLGAVFIVEKFAKQQKTVSGYWVIFDFADKNVLLIDRLVYSDVTPPIGAASWSVYWKNALTDAQVWHPFDIEKYCDLEKKGQFERVCGN